MIIIVIISFEIIELIMFYLKSFSIKKMNMKIEFLWKVCYERCNNSPVFLCFVTIFFFFNKRISRFTLTAEKEEKNKLFVRHIVWSTVDFSVRR